MSVCIISNSIDNIACGLLWYLVIAQVIKINAGGNSMT